MGKVRVHNFTITLDGFGAGTDQRLEEPFGDGVDHLHDWMDPLFDGTATGLDAEVGLDAESFGATIMGRNMFGPIRGEWPDESWTGWWGANPPYHHDVWVFTHHPRAAVQMEGGTTFHFTDEPIEVVLDRAKAAAGEKDVIVAGGASVVRQYLRAGLIDQLDIAVAPILAGAGEPLFADLGNALKQYEVVQQISSPAVTHVRLVRR
ncbi:dihydrofolate reductase family protein [Kribbella italica]|uniref:Dihydrofolate reductase n=1 Tax=Kribbella italica TaxID=1540520 RepID=A0A7W9J3I2_9ACTN|nr:dihydrofolate reductase family protein [Kribbella italica]MBB5834878.1 dihydrofolate reductase [Kribbella italica]